jgi:hypothetical protein
MRSPLHEKNFDGSVDGARCTTDVGQVHTRGYFVAFLYG